jgi:hypothetical protein
MADIMHRIHASNLAHHEKSALGRALERMRSHGRSALARASSGAMATEAGDIARQYGETALAGAALGAAHVMLPTGLDVSVGKTTKVKIPLDLAGAVVVGAVAATMGGEEGAEDVKTLGSGMAAVFGFRKTYDFLAAKRKKDGKKVGGSFAGEGDDDVGDEWASPHGAEGSDAALVEAVRRL